MSKKACVIHTASKSGDAEIVAGRLVDDGYVVCTTEVTTEIASSAKAGDTSSLPADAIDCISGAEVCVILVDDTIDLGAIGGLVSDQGCRVVTVGGSPDDLPEQLDDIGDAHVPSPESPELLDEVRGVRERSNLMGRRTSREKRNGSSASRCAFGRTKSVAILVLHLIHSSVCARSLVASPAFAGEPQ